MKILFHDVDGCLNANGEDDIPHSGNPLTAQQIEKFAELGKALDSSDVDFMVINTGRALADTAILVEPINSLKLKYLIGEHGAAFHDVAKDEAIQPGEQLGEKLADTLALMDWYRTEGSILMHQRIGKPIGVLNKVANLTLDCRQSDLDSQLVFDQVKQLIETDSPFEHTEFVFNHSQTDGFVDVMSPIHKGDGIAFICSRPEVQAAATKITTFAIGNGLNDLPMLEVADVPICPSNAELEVKACCEARGGIVSEHSFIETTLNWLRTIS